MLMNQSSEEMQWFVMRDLKRYNAKQPAYIFLKEKGIEVFTPMKWEVTTKQGVKKRIERPIIPDLLFVHASREQLDPIVATTDTLQYRFMRNHHGNPMIVSEKEMSRFIHAIQTSTSPKYYLPEEVLPSMLKRKIRVIGGPLDGYEGKLISTRGTKTKRLMVELKGYFMVAVEVNPEFIQLI